MPLWLPQKGIKRVQHNLAGAPTTLRPGTVVVTDGSSAATKGTEVELISSTNFDAYELWILATNYGTSTLAARACLDIMIGSATAEIVIANLLAGCCGAPDGTGSRSGGKSWRFPLYIPSGSRIAAQVAGDRLGAGMYVAVWIRNTAPPGRVGTKVTTYGIGTVPAGTGVTAANGSEGSWTEITASTTSDHFACMPSFQPPNDATLTPIKAFSLDIGIGAATEELLGGYEQSYMYKYDASEMCEGPVGFNEPVYAPIPSGSRLTARLSTNGAADAAAPQVALHCVSE